MLFRKNHNVTDLNELLLTTSELKELTAIIAERRDAAQDMGDLRLAAKLSEWVEELGR